jgi:ParB family chromosome partitioning protein
MSAKRGLGGGLSNLIPNVVGVEDPTKNGQNTPKTDNSPTVSTDLAVYSEIELSRIAANPNQPRTVFDEDAMAELVHSLKEVGLLQPIVVRPIADGKTEFEIVAGERRWRAAQIAGFKKIPAIIRKTADDVLLRDALLENLHRANLNALEEAAAYQQLLQDFGCTQDELADRIGRSRPQITNTIRLLKLPRAVQLRVAAGVLSAGHARALLALGSEAEMESLATKIVAEGLSVRATEEIVALGGEKTKPTKKKSGGKNVSAPALQDIAERLSEKFETRVKVEMKRNKGSINIEFSTLPDLQRIIDILEK